MLRLNMLGRVGARSNCLGAMGWSEDHVMRGALGGPRVLLRRLREVMAEQVSAQERLDKIVVLIAANMVVEVCSVYVLSVVVSLELYAPDGLMMASVPLTYLRS